MMAKEKQKEPEEEVKEIKEAKIVEVTTQTAPAIQMENGDIVSPIELQVITYNLIQRIKKSVA